MYVYIPEASLEPGKQRTLRKSSSIWLTLPPPIRVALWVETRKLCRYVTVETDNIDVTMKDEQPENLDTMRRKAH